jgi:hypothetical protein
MTSELFLSILAMDSYNRGYAPGISGLSSEAGTKIGNATVLDQELPTGSQTAGFYAIAYTMGEDQNAKTIISYRGTDAFALR